MSDAGRFDVADIWPYELRKGNSNSPREGACTMDAVSWFAYGRLGDEPECACPVLTAYVIGGQDVMPHEMRQLLKPFIFRLIGSRDPFAEKKRLRHLVLSAVRVFTPLAFDAIGFVDQARALRALSNSASYVEMRRIAADATRIADATWIAATTPREFVSVGCGPAVAAAAAAAAATTKAASHAAECATRADAAADAASESAHAAHGAHGAVDPSNIVWYEYINTLDGALDLGRQGDFDVAIVPERLLQFAEQRR